ncbi:MAG: hypothetical protein DWQ05_15150 [Calditrichaeota bacterium]|nr:MAG: hypothetical protein DWQ05_15150 [Calditrichota bacterium]
MSRFIIIASFFIFVSIACQKETSLEPYDYEQDTPTWLKTKIDSMSTDHEYFGLKVYRYVWKGTFVYHFMIPISSCAYCEVYGHSGSKIEFDDDAMFQDFLNDKKYEVLVREWRK